MSHILLKRVLTWVCLITLIIIVSSIYHPLLNSYFEQDEWAGFGNIIQLKDQSNIFQYSIKLRLGHYVPLTRLLIYLSYVLFGLQYPPYALSSIFLHLTVTVIFYFLASELFKRRSIALLSTAFFGLNAGIYQATSWVVANIATHGATLFGLLSTISFINFLKREKKVYFYTSMALLIISLLFKEITLGLFVVFTIVFYIYKKADLVKKHTYPAIILIIFLSFVTFRSYSIFSSHQEGGRGLGISQTKNKVILNIALSPIIGTVQSIIPPQALLKTGSSLASFLPLNESIKGSPNSTKFNKFVEKQVMTIQSLLIFGLLTFTLILLRKRGENTLFKVGLFGITFASINSFVYALSPGRTSVITILDSRNIYFPAIGSTILLISVLLYLTKQSFRNLLILSIPLIIINTSFLSNKIEKLAKVGHTRKNIVEFIQQKYPTLPNRVIFYTRSDTAYYGLPVNENIMPFQSGFGHTLLVIYSSNDMVPTEFLENMFLWKITEQGYKEIGSMGYGYFRNIELLEKTYTKYKLPPESIIAFSWSSKENSISDISEEIRSHLSKAEN